MKLRNAVVYGTLALTLAGCAEHSLYGGQFWEQKSMSDAAYVQGPRAQTNLSRDLAQCLVEIKETERTSTMRNALPDSPDPTAANADEKDLADWNTPSHQGALLAEHSNYHDFDGCMNYKGWQRVDTVPYDVAGIARDNYFRANVKYGSDPARKKAEEQVAKTDFNGLNN
jgi:hypothetical protein